MSVTRSTVKRLLLGLALSSSLALGVGAASGLAAGGPVLATGGCGQCTHGQLGAIAPAALAVTRIGCGSCI